MATIKKNGEWTYIALCEDEVRAYAKSLGCKLLIPKANQLFLDIDNEESYLLYRKQLPILREFFTSVQTTEKPSRSGMPFRLHIIVDLSRNVSSIERIALQACLGSDTTRELISLKEETIGSDISTCFFEKEEKDVPNN